METFSKSSPFVDFGPYLQGRYGRTMYRVPIDLGFGCPHVTATHDGCDYCGTSRARPEHVTAEMSVAEQVASGAAFVRSRYDGAGLIAYFQAGTPTNAPIEALRAVVNEVLSLDEFPVIILSTRPDCLSAATLDWLAALNENRDVWIELGVQTVHDRTLERIHRGHDFACAASAVMEIASRGIQAAAHVILGLPGESSADFEETARRLGELPFCGIKIHNLHIVRDTEFERLYRQGEVRAMDEHEYGEVLMNFLRHVPGQWPVMRLMSDTPRDQLVAPKWWMNKDEFRRYIRKQMIERGWTQGDLTSSRESGAVIPAADADPSQTQTIHVQSSLWHTRQKHSRLTHLLNATDISLRTPDQGAAVISVGFGSGKLALDAFDVLPEKLADHIVFYGLGIEPSVLSAQRQHYPDYDGVLTALAIHGKCRRTWGRISIHWGDPRRNVMRIRGTADLMILEPERPEYCPMLFSLDFLRRALRLLSAKGALVSASEAAPLRGALQRLGLHLGQASPEATFRPGTIAAWDPTCIRYPLDEFSRRIAAESVSGIPYRDTDLTSSRRQIIQHRERVAQRMRRRGMPTRLSGPTSKPGR